jgi:hypothetical protein
MSPDEGSSWVELEVADTFGQLYDPGSSVEDAVILEDYLGRQIIVMVGIWGGTSIDIGDDNGDGAVWIGTLDD